MQTRNNVKNFPKLGQWHLKKFWVPLFFALACFCFRQTTRMIYKSYREIRSCTCATAARNGFFNRGKGFCKPGLLFWKPENMTSEMYDNYIWWHFFLMCVSASCKISELCVVLMVCKVGIDECILALIFLN